LVVFDPLLQGINKYNGTFLFCNSSFLAMCIRIATRVLRCWRD
jgi:hypothetical protein